MWNTSWIYQQTYYYVNKFISDTPKLTPNFYEPKLMIYFPT